MSERANEIVFMPGFDGVAELRGEFVDALSSLGPVRSIGYPNRKLESLNGYARHVSSQLAPASRPVVVAESFSGLVAARWASRDPHVAALVLCAAFARNPVSWSGIGATMPGAAQFFGANFLNPMGFITGDEARKRWSRALATAISSLHRDVIAERLRLISTEDVGAELGALRIPIVLVQFEDDMVIDAQAREALESACHQPRVVRVPGPHFTIETRPREVAAALREHLAALLA